MCVTPDPAVIQLTAPVRLFARHRRTGRSPSTAGVWGWALLGEIVPTSQRAEGSSAGATVNWTANLVVSLIFLPLLVAVGEAITFWIFAVVCLVGVAFVTKWVPETRGRHANEIGEDLHRRWDLAHCAS